MNPFELLKNMGSIQERMKDIQQKMSKITAVGRAGGDMVTVTLNGQFEMLSINISQEAIAPNNLVLLQDLIRGAYIDAHAKIREAIGTEMTELTGGLPIPPGLLGP